MRFRKNEDEAKEVSSLIIGYKFALGLVEVLVGLGITFLGDKALIAYEAFKGPELWEDHRDLFVNLADRSIPYLVAHRTAIVVLLLVIGIIKMVSCIAIWAGKEWGVHMLLFLMLALLPFDLFDLFRIFIIGHISFSSIILNVINIWIILSLTHNHPVKYLHDLDWKNLFNSNL